MQGLQYLNTFYIDNAYAFTQTGGNFDQLRGLYNRALCKA